MPARTDGHSEQKRAERQRIAATRTAALKRELVDSGPFLAWVRGRVREYGTVRATAKGLAMNPSLLARILREGGPSLATS